VVRDTRVVGGDVEPPLDMMCLLRCFRRLRFQNVLDDVDDEWLRQPDSPELDLWTPVKAEVGDIRAFERRQQAIDPTFMMPSIRFAPADHLLNAVLRRWLIRFRTRGDGECPFTDHSIRFLLVCCKRNSTSS